MSLDLRITHGRTAFLDLAIQGSRLDQDVREAVRDMAATYRGRVIAELRAAKSGRQYGARSFRRDGSGQVVGGGRSFYRRQKRTVTLFGGRTGSYMAVTKAKKETKAYTASAPGQAPAVFTGNLLRSVMFKIPSKGKGWSARVFAHRGMARHRHLLEFGTGPRATRHPVRNVGRVAPRPIWGKYQREIEAELPRRVVTALERFQRGS